MPATATSRSVGRIMKKLGLVGVVFTFTFASLAACSPEDDDVPGGASSGGAVDSGTSTSEGGTTADSGTPGTDSGTDAGARPDADADAGCASNQYRDGAECKPCSGACAAGTYESAACSKTADRVCASCTAITDCATVTCTNSTDQVCAACASTHYLAQGSCVACSGACPAGQQQTAACSATSDRVCTACTPIANCTNITCTNAADQVCTACVNDYYLSNNACVACSGACAAEQYQSAACSAMADRVCSPCTAVAQCASTLTCTAADDSQCTSCNSGFYLVEGAADTCAACSGACPAGQYQSAACGVSTDRACSSCTAIGQCVSTVTCTSATDQQCTACAAGYVVVDGVADTCARPTTCADLKLRVPAAADGVYTIDPDGPGPLGEFDVYCDMTTDGGGWTLIGKVGNGTWPELTNQQYIDLVANPIADVGGALLLDGAMPAPKEIAFFRRDRTNAMYHAKTFANEPVVRVNWDSAQDNAADGRYFQQRKVAEANWDFWHALRDARRWSSAVSTPDSVSNYGTDFVLTRTLASFDAATNTVTHATEGDTTFGFWDVGTVTLADNSTLEVSRHGGLLGDGVNNFGWLWILTLNPADGRFKNETFQSLSTIWLR